MCCRKKPIVMKNTDSYQRCYEAILGYLSGGHTKQHFLGECSVRLSMLVGVYIFLGVWNIHSCYLVGLAC